MYEKKQNLMRYASRALFMFLLVAALAAQTWAVTITINSPASGATVNPGQSVAYSVTVNNSVAGIKHVSIAGLDGFTAHGPGPGSDYPPSPPTTNVTFNNPLVHYVDIPVGQPGGSATLITVTVEDYVDGIVTASRQVNVSGGGDTTAPTFSGIGTAVRQAGNTSMNLTWSAATDGVTNAANMRYDIYYDAVQANVFTGSPEKTVTGVTADTVTGLTAGTTYFVGVRAKDQANNTDSNTVTIQVAPLAAGPIPAPLIDLNATTLTLGSMTAWANHGSLGGVFNSITEFSFTGNPVVEEVSGRRAATFNSNGMRATVSPPASITGANPNFTVIFQSYNPNFTDGAAADGVEVSFEWGTRAAGQWAGFGIGYNTWGAASFFGGGRDIAYGPVTGGIAALAPQPGAWHVSAITVNGTTAQVTVYVDKTQTNQVTNTGVPPFGIVGIPFIMGGTSDGVTNRNVTGSFARVQVYDAVLDAAQIATVTDALNALPNAAEDWMLYQ